VFVCKCKGVMEGEREKVDAREIRQVRGSGGGILKRRACGVHAVGLSARITPEPPQACKACVCR